VEHFIIMDQATQEGLHRAYRINLGPFLYSCR
jgi:hypothetical protein